MNKILLIGCGHMGLALLRAWHRKTSNFFTVIDPKQYKKLNRWHKKRVSAFNNINKIKNTQHFDIIIFAVKPQIANKAMKQFIDLTYKKNVLFISIIAGKKIIFFNNFLPLKNQFIRVMPNMPAFVEEGMSCLVSNKEVSRQNKNKASALFGTVGKILWFKHENELDKVTAISGSGPGYFFLFIDLLEKAAAELGFNKKILKQLVHQTALGSIRLLIRDNKSAEKLTQNIAIKGGTTEAAIKIFKKNNQLKKIMGLKFDRILFDNMSPKNLKKGVKLTNKLYKTEASGGIKLNNVRKIASTGVKRISVGQITHSAPAINFKLEI